MRANDSFVITYEWFKNKNIQKREKNDFIRWSIPCK